MALYVDFASGRFNNGLFLILYVTFLNVKLAYINSGLQLFQLLQTSHINA